MHVMSISRLALIWLIHCGAVTSLYSNTTSVLPHEGSPQSAIALRPLIPSSSASIPAPSTTGSLNEPSAPGDGFETTSTFTTSCTTVPNAENASSTSPAGGTATKNIEHVDFNQWLNMDIFEEEDVPSLSMLWDYPDYGPLDKAGIEEAATERPHDSHAMSWNASNYRPPISDRDVFDLDMALSDEYSPDSDDDRPGICDLEADFSYKRALPEVFEADSTSPAWCSLEELWSKHMRVLNSVFRAKHQSESEDVPPFDDRAGPLPSLGLGALALLDLVTNDERRRKRRKQAPSEHGSAENKECEGAGIQPPLELSLNDCGDNVYNIVLQLGTRPMSQEQLAAEVKSIYDSLAMVEFKCVEVDNREACLPEDPGLETKINNEQWQDLVALHRTLLDEHNDFFLVSQHPSVSPALRRLAERYAMPARLWRHGIHSFLELLRHRLPDPEDHILAVTHLAFCVMRVPHQAPDFEDTWLEYLGDLGRYRVAVDDNDTRDSEDWIRVAQDCHTSATNAMRAVPEGEGQRQHDFQSSPDVESENDDPSPVENSLGSSPQTSASSQDNPMFEHETKLASSHTCSTCNASFRRLCDLRKHVKYHTKPLACPDANCTCSFGRRRDLIRHQKAVHQDAHEADKWSCPHEGCQLNGVVFGRRDNLLRHMRKIHSTDGMRTSKGKRRHK